MKTLVDRYRQGWVKATLQHKTSVHCTSIIPLFSMSHLLRFCAGAPSQITSPLHVNSSGKARNCASPLSSPNLDSPMWKACFFSPSFQKPRSKQSIKTASPHGCPASLNAAKSLCTGLNNLGQACSFYCKHVHTCSFASSIWECFDSW